MRIFTSFSFISVLLFGFTVYGDNLHLVEADEQSGYAIYRTGKPDAKDIDELCRLGVTEMVVLSGNAIDHEIKYANRCPQLKVVYDLKQDAKVPLTTSFLEFFDNWVTVAKQTGKRIAFRCNCGCHRTGRLAAYYQMKYQNLTYADAIIVMGKHGRAMFLHPQLKPQVRSLYDYIKGRTCSVESKHCLINDTGMVAPAIQLSRTFPL